MSAVVLERIRWRLNELIAVAAEEIQADREQLERDAAQAVEQATTTHGLQAAYQQGRNDGIAEEQRNRAALIADERRAFLALIEEARQRWKAGGVTNMALRQLGEAVALRGDW